MGATGTNINNTSIRDTLRSMQFAPSSLFIYTITIKLH